MPPGAAATLAPSTPSLAPGYNLMTVVLKSLYLTLLLSISIDFHAPCYTYVTQIFLKEKKKTNAIKPSFRDAKKHVATVHSILQSVFVLRALIYVEHNASEVIIY